MMLEEVPKIKKNKREEFQDLRFGMFVHFGLYSQGKEHEWHQNKHKMTHKDYKAKFLKSFNPDPKGVEQWVKVAKEMGAKYIVLTSKHHDGFCLWDTKVKHGVDPDYHIRSTKFWKENKTGIVELLFEAGKKHDVRIGLYYSTIDWSWTDKDTSSRWKKWLGIKIPPHHLNFKEKNCELHDHYVTYYMNQVLELADLFPDNLLFWFDGYQFKHRNHKNGFLNYLKYDKLHELMTKLCPHMLVGNNSGITSGTGNMGKTDLLLFENSAGRGEKKGAPWPRSSPLPGEVCLTINKAWGYAENDKDYKDAREIQKLVLANAFKNANTLLNFGPKPDGFIAQDQTNIAEKIGNYLKPFKPAIYRTRNFKTYDWGWVAKMRKNSGDSKKYIYVKKYSPLVIVDAGDNANNYKVMYTSGDTPDANLEEGVLNLKNVAENSLFCI